MELILSVLGGNTNFILKALQSRNIKQQWIHILRIGKAKEKQNKANKET